jgi:hypothetical protein
MTKPKTDKKPRSKAEPVAIALDAALTALSHELRNIKTLVALTHDGLMDVRDEMRTTKAIAARLELAHDQDLISAQTRYDIQEKTLALLASTVADLSTSVSKLADELAGNTAAMDTLSERHTMNSLLIDRTNSDHHTVVGRIDELAAGVRLLTERINTLRAPVLPVAGFRVPGYKPYEGTENQPVLNWTGKPVVFDHGGDPPKLRFCPENFAGEPCIRTAGHEGHHRNSSGQLFGNLMDSSATRAEYGACMNRYYPASAGADKDVWYTCALDKGHSPPHTDGKGTTWGATPPGIGARFMDTVIRKPS